MERSNIEYCSMVVLYQIRGITGLWSLPIAKARSEEDAIRQFKEIVNDREGQRDIIKVERAT